MEFKMIRSADKEEVKAQVLERIKENDYQSCIDYADIRMEEFVSSLRRIMKMREIADEAGVGFAVFFSGPSGARYYISNVNHWVD